MAAAEDLNAFLDALMVDEDLLPEQVVLFGFSQGTMMALARRAPPGRCGGGRGGLFWAAACRPSC
jgi:pimeloyl-ACP methyl ester carboxylesterase